MTPEEIAKLPNDVLVLTLVHEAAQARIRAETAQLRAESAAADANNAANALHASHAHYSAGALLLAEIAKRGLKSPGVEPPVVDPGPGEIGEMIGVSPADVFVTSPIDQGWMLHGAPTIFGGNDTIALFKAGFVPTDVRHRQVIQPGWRSGILSADSHDPTAFLDLDWDDVLFLPALTGWNARLRRTRGVTRRVTMLGTLQPNPPEGPRDRHGLYENTAGGRTIEGCTFRNLGGNPIQFVCRVLESAIGGEDGAPIVHVIRDNVFVNNAWNQYGHGGGAGADITIADARPNEVTDIEIVGNFYDSGSAEGGDRAFIACWAPPPKAGSGQPRGRHGKLTVRPQSIVSRSKPNRPVIIVDGTREVYVEPQDWRVGWTPGPLDVLIEVDRIKDLPGAEKVVIAPQDAPGFISYRSKIVAKMSEGWSL